MLHFLVQEKKTFIVRGNTKSCAFDCYKTKTYIFANRLDRDDTALNEPSHQDLHCLPF